MALPGEGLGLWLSMTIPMVWRILDLLILQVSTPDLLIYGASTSEPTWSGLLSESVGEALVPKTWANQATQILHPWASSHSSTLRALTLSQNVPISFLFPFPFPSPEAALLRPPVSWQEADSLGDCRPVAKHLRTQGPRRCLFTLLISEAWWGKLWEKGFQGKKAI